MCGEERDLVASGEGVYGGGGPSVVVVVVRAELRGRTMGGEDGVKRKGGLGKAAAVADDARLRVRVLAALWTDDDDAPLRAVGEVSFGGREMAVEVRSGLGCGSEWDIDLGRFRLRYDMVRIRVRCESRDRVGCYNRTFLFLIMGWLS